MSKKKKNKNTNTNVNEAALEEELELLEDELELNNENEQSEDIKAFDDLHQADEMIQLIDVDDDDYDKVDAFGNSREEVEEDEFADVEFIHQDDKKKKKSGKYIAYQIFRTVVTMVALVAFGYASYELMLVHLENDSTYETKDEISNMFLQDVENNAGGNVIVNSNGETIVMQNTSNGKAFVWDYEKMLDYNSEAVGYIRQDNGDYIDYPILQHGDNDYYLYHLPDHTWSSMGSIFLDYRIEGGLEADYSIVYGHYIGKRANNIMFGSLNWYWDWPYYYKEHPTFDIYVKERHYKYYVFSILKVPAAGDPVYDPYFESDEERYEFFKDVEERSYREFTEAPEITKDSKVIMLSTCTTDKTVRFVMFLVRGEEIQDVPGVDYDNLPTDDNDEDETTTAPDETTSKEESDSSEETSSSNEQDSSEAPSSSDEPASSTPPDETTAPPTPTGPGTTTEPSSSNTPTQPGTTNPPSQSSSSEEPSSSVDETTAPPETSSGEETTEPSSSDTPTEPDSSEEPDSSDEASDTGTDESTSAEEQTTPME